MYNHQFTWQEWVQGAWKAKEQVQPSELASLQV
jgi:hypothetical protein